MIVVNNLKLSLMMCMREDLTEGNDCLAKSTLLDRKGESNQLLKSIPREQYSHDLSVKDTKILELKNTLTKCEEERRTIIDKTKAVLNKFQTDIDERVKTLNEISTINYNQSQQVVELKSSQNLYHLSAVTQSQELASKEDRIWALREKLKNAEHKVTDLMISKKYEGNAILQLQQLKADNEMLIKMLSKTKKTESLGCDLLPNACSIKPLLSYPTKRKSDIERENDWIPQIVHSICSKFMLKNKIKEEVLNELVKEIRKMWVKREADIVRHINNTYNYEIKYLAIQADRAKQKPI
jgi:hypothetical protein